MNTQLHRSEIETEVSRLMLREFIEGDSSLDTHMRKAILRIAAAVQAIIVEIERTRSR